MGSGPKGSRPLKNYLKDASNFRGNAEKVVFPTTENEIANLLQEANRTKIPITVAGAGTGLTGARVPQGGVVLSLESMNKILKVHWDEKTREGYVVVQPGVPLKILEGTLEAKGVFYPPDPGEKEAFIGGTVATNASGARSFKYGPTRRYVRRLRIILPTGDLLEFSRGQQKAKGRTFLLTLSNGKPVKVPIPTYTMPNVKNAAGYFAEENMDLVDLFIGSEGTLGVFTEIELKILKKPEAVLGGILFFQSERDCFRFAKRVRDFELDPRLLEFFDSRSLALLARKHSQLPFELLARDVPPKAGLPSQTGAALFFEEEHPMKDTHAIQERWIRTLQDSQGAVPHPWVSSDPERQQAFREFRHDLPVLVNEQVAQNGFRKIGTDMAVPESQAEAMFNFYLEELPRTGIDYVIFGHLGDNHLHVNLLSKTQAEFDRSKAIYAQLAEKAIALKGTISAEHGIGKVRIPYLEQMVGREGLKEMASVKRALDPNGILNRGNIVPVELLRGEE